MIQLVVLFDNRGRWNTIFWIFLQKTFLSPIKIPVCKGH